MKKLRLDLDALVVESFQTALDGTARGTVAANLEAKGSQSDCKECNYTLPPTCMSCGEPVCPIGSYTECPSCINSCSGCDGSCVCPVEPVVIGPAHPRNAL